MVSADYILGSDVPMNPDISVREIVSKTGLTEDNVTSLIAWANLLNILQMQHNEELTDIEKGVIGKATRIGPPDLAQSLCITLIRKLISAVIDRADDICTAFKSYILCVEDNKNFKYGHPPKSVTKEIYTDLAKQGYTIMPVRHAMRLEAERIQDILLYEVIPAVFFVSTDGRLLRILTNLKGANLMKTNDKQYYIYLRATKERIPVSKEEFDNFYQGPADEGICVSDNPITAASF